MKRHALIGACAAFAATLPAALTFARQCSTKLTVPEGCFHRVSTNETYGCVEIGPDAEVFIDDAAALIVTGAGGLDCRGTINIDVGRLRLTGGGTSHLDGWIVLLTDASAVTVESANHTLTGDGGIAGIHHTAAVRIGAGRRLTSKVRIEGALQIAQLPGSLNALPVFENHNVVSANVGGLLTINSDVAIADIADAQWRTEKYATSELAMRSGSNFLKGDFVVTNQAALRIYQTTISTGGTLTYNSGLISLSAQAVFDADTVVGSCPTLPTLPLYGPIGFALCP